MEEFLTSVHAIEERIRAKRPANVLYYDKISEKTNRYINLAKLFGIPTKEISREELRNYGAFHVALSIPQDTLQGGTHWLKQQIKKLRAQRQATILLLDGITDLHNIGAILRSSALFNVNLVIYPDRRSASGDHDVVARVSAGASEIVDHGSVINLNYAIDLLKENGFWIYGADMKGNNIRNLGHGRQKVAHHYGLVLGAEGKGISQKIAENCDEILSIPTNQIIDSLNVSVACGILLYTLQADRDAVPSSRTMSQDSTREVSSTRRQDRRPYNDRDSRPERNDRPRFSDRDDRKPRDRQDRRPYNDRDSRPERNDRPRFSDRDDRKPRDRQDRRPYNDRDSRPERNDRPRFSDRDDRKPRDRQDRRPQSDRGSRPERNDHPRFSDRNERKPFTKDKEFNKLKKKEERRKPNDQFAFAKGKDRRNQRKR